MNKEELSLKFRYIENGENVYKIESKNYNVFIIRENEWYGIGLEVEIETSDFFEKFENFMVITKLKIFEDRSVHKFLEIITDRKDLQNEFALVCCDLLNFIDDDEQRKTFKNNPQIWLTNWKNLIGNTLKKEENYSLLAELLAMNYLMKQDEMVVYDDYGTHDMETGQASYEIKSTIARYGYEIHINGQHQLEKENKDLYIIFVRFEKSIDGYSISEVLDEIRKYDRVNMKRIEEKIKHITTDLLNEKYKILETRLYCVDNKFPKIINESFKDEKMPEGIIQIDYTVDLSGMNYDNIDLNI